MTIVEKRPLWALCTMNDETLPESTPSGYSFEYVDISNVSEGHISDELETFTFREAPSRARRLGRVGDVIVSTVRTYLRAIARVEESEERRVYSTGFAVIRPDTDLVDPRYIAYMLSSNQVMEEIVATSVGVSYPAIQGSVLHRMRVPYHDLSVQRAIADFLDRETSQIDAMLGKMDLLVAALQTRARIVQTRAVFGLAADAGRAATHSRSVLSGIPEHWGRTKFGYDFFESTERKCAT